MQEMDSAALARGVAAISAGNHAIATAYAARCLQTNATVIMPRNANRARVEACKKLGATVHLTDDIARAFVEVETLCAQEGRTFVHPFEGHLTARGTGTLGLEILSQLPNADAVVVPIGGGGLCAGVAAAVKQAAPHIHVFGVEPRGADTMHRSFASGQPASIEKVRTIADSLGAPHAAPYSMGLCRQFVDELVMIDDDMIRDAMRSLFVHARLAVEPAGAAATAAVLGPLIGQLQGKRVVSIVCGSNMDPATFEGYLAGSGPTTC
jgi:threonine dehydratase